MLAIFAYSDRYLYDPIMTTERKPPKTRLLVFLETRQHAALKRLSETSGAPMNWHIREAVSSYLARQNRRKGK